MGIKNVTKSTDKNPKVTVPEDANKKVTVPTQNPKPRGTWSGGMSGILKGKPKVDGKPASNKKAGDILHKRAKDAEAFKKGLLS